MTRTFKRGPRTFDAREAVERAWLTESSDPSCAILRMVVRHTTPAVRPDDVLTALRLVAQFSPARSPRVTRVIQGTWDPAAARVADPLAADKHAAGT